MSWTNDYYILIFGQGAKIYSMDFSTVLDFSKPLDVTVFDQLVSTFYNSSGPKIFEHYLKQAEAGDVLKQYQQHQKAWETVDKIIEQSKNINSKVNLLLLFLVHCITSSREIYSKQMECITKGAF